jgi:hypothetical protein
VEVLVDDGYYGAAPTLARVTAALGFESVSQAVTIVPALASGRVFV